VDALKERRLAGVVAADEDGDVSQGQFDLLDPLEVVDLDGRDEHWWSGARLMLKRLKGRLAAL
jgi:hypothetical protein